MNVDRYYTQSNVILGEHLTNEQIAFYNENGFPPTVLASSRSWRRVGGGSTRSHGSSDCVRITQRSGACSPSDSFVVSIS